MGRVIDIRGTHGSGKSFVPKQFILAHEDVRAVLGRPMTYEGSEGVMGYYIPKENLYILGKYHNACGGCDGIKTQAEIKARVDAALADGMNVMLEGILVAHTFGPWSEFARGKDWHFCILDTPLDMCISRVNDRRAVAGKGPLQDTKNIVRDWYRTRQLYKMFLDAGHQAHWVEHEHVMSQIVEVLHAKAQ